MKSSLKIILKSTNPLPEIKAEEKQEAQHTEKRGRRNAGAEEASKATKAK